MALTAGSVLGAMSVVNNALSVGVGEPDEARALTAIALAYTVLDSLLAPLPRVGGRSIEIATTTDTETTPWPDNLLRLDGIQPLDRTSGSPIGPVMEPTQTTGGHAGSPTWLLQVLGYAGSGVGRPGGYWTSDRTIYWMGRPSGVYYYRVYGYIGSSGVAPARADAFPFQPNALLPIATFAAKLLATGVGDDLSDYDTLVAATFGPVIKAIRKSTRTKPTGRYFAEVHDT